MDNDRIEGRAGLTKVPTEALLKAANIENGKLQAYIDELVHELKVLEGEVKKKDAEIKKLREAIDTPEMKVTKDGYKVYGQIKLNKRKELYVEVTDYNEMHSLVLEARVAELVRNYKKMLAAQCRLNAHFRKQLNAFMLRCSKVSGQVCEESLSLDKYLALSFDDILLATAFKTEDFVPMLPPEWISDEKLLNKRAEYYEMVAKKTLESLKHLNEDV